MLELCPLLRVYFKGIDVTAPEHTTSLQLGSHSYSTESFVFDAVFKVQSKYYSFLHNAHVVDGLRKLKNILVKKGTTSRPILIILAIEKGFYASTGKDALNGCQKSIVSNIEDNLENS